ncbi:MAG: hypothetical protein KDA32_06680 [Phycisphaerales bacterium]|nr:hypothetical protein [Phycisphaerales bacterium]
MPHKMLIALFVSCLALGAMGGCPQQNQNNNNNNQQNPDNNQSGQDNPGNNTGNNTGGDNKPGDNTGDPNKPGDNTGGSNTGGDNTGGSNTGGDNKPGDNTGGDNTGGNTGGDNTGGNNNGGNTTEPAKIEGSYNGTVRCTITQSLNGTPQNPTNMNRNIGIMFDADGVPNKIIVPGFSAGSSEFEVGITKVGQTQTVVKTSGNLTATYIVTITQASYASTMMSVEMSIDYEGRTTGGDLTQDGTAVVTGSAMLNADDNIDVTINADYMVILSTPSGTISFDTEETTDCAGTLIRN